MRDLFINISFILGGLFMILCSFAFGVLPVIFIINLVLLALGYSVIISNWLVVGLWIFSLMYILVVGALVGGNRQ